MLAEKQLDLKFTVETKRNRGSESTFLPNIKLPVHGWFRYSAGFSAQWVIDVLEHHCHDNAITLLDPFAGSGTTLLAADEFGASSIGLEAHPFVYRIARAKLMWSTNPKIFSQFANDVLQKAKNYSNQKLDYPDLIYKCYPDDRLQELDALRMAFLSVCDGNFYSELTWLAITSILRSCSPVGTSNMELIQPKKTKKKSLRPFEAFVTQVDLMCSDMVVFQNTAEGLFSKIQKDDARICQSVPDNSIDFVITSPPYANNFDYADATRLEMSFWGEIEGWKDLGKVVRQYLVRSCSQHASSDKAELESVFENSDLDIIRQELLDVYDSLAQERLLHGGKKNYHLMIAAYFSDMSKIWKSLRRVCKTGSQICFVVGDSAPYGIHVPVEKWLGELACSAGFIDYTFEKTRDRNTKWKNRKHRVPLQEGRLWVEG